MLEEPHRVFEELLAEGVGPHRAAQLAAIDYGRSRSLEVMSAMLELSKRRAP